VCQDLLAAPVHFNQAVQAGLGTLNSKGKKCRVKMNVRESLAVLHPCATSISPHSRGSKWLRCELREAEVQATQHLTG